MCTVLEHLEVHLSRVSCLDLIVDPLKVPPEPVLRCCIQHFGSNVRHSRGPKEE